jgi:hypothetical protein
MPTCSACGAEAAPGDAFCQACGAAVSAPAATVTLMPPIVAPEPDRPVAVGGDQAAARAADQLIGRSQPNQTYVGHRLLYEQNIVESMDPLSWTFVKEMLFQALMIWFAGFALSIVPSLIFIVGSAQNSGVLRLLGGLGLFIAGPVLWVYFWFHRISAVKSEWKLLVDDQGPAAGQVFAHITWALKRRRTPIRSLKVRRLSQPGRQQRDYLELRDGIFTGFVSAFAYGDDLYIGWSLLWNLSPFRWVIAWLGRLYLVFTGRGSQLHLMHRYENAKAMREAMHSAAREGVDAAAGAVACQGSGTIGSDIEVEVVASSDDVPRFLADSSH